jgi:hypothetical protein
VFTVPVIYFKSVLSNLGKRRSGRAVAQGKRFLCRPRLLHSPLGALLSCYPFLTSVLTLSVGQSLSGQSRVRQQTRMRRDRQKRRGKEREVVTGGGWLLARQTAIPASARTQAIRACLPDSLDVLNVAAGCSANKLGSSCRYLCFPPYSSTANSCANLD